MPSRDPLTVQEQQYWINAALAQGVSRADIDAFIAENGVQDLPRILTAFAPNPGPSATAYVASATSPSDPGSYATPTPLSNDVGQITQPAPSDGVLVASGLPSFSGPRLAYSSNDQGASADEAPPASQATLMPASGIPMWAIVAAVAVLVLFFWKDK